MTTVFEIIIKHNAGVFVRAIRDYKVIELTDKQVTMSRSGSIGTYIIPMSSMDKLLEIGTDGWHYYTKDKSKLKEYGAVLDEKALKWISTKIAQCESWKKKCSQPWDDVSSKKKKEVAVAEDDI